MYGGASHRRTPRSKLSSLTLRTTFRAKLPGTEKQDLSVTHSDKRHRELGGKVTKRNN
jgi:hypothetical protein